MSNIVELPQKGKRKVVFYEVSDLEGKAIWGGENPSEALKWYRNSPLNSKIWVSQYEVDKEDAELMLDSIEITSIVLTTIADSMMRWK